MANPIFLGLFYAAIFVGNGASSPYLPVWFHHRGLTGTEIGWILAAPMLARIVTAPAIAMWADGFKLRRTALVGLGLGTAAFYVLLVPQWGFFWWFAVWFVASSLYSSLPPLTDVIVLARARVDGFNYGWPRGMGSAGFVLGNVVMGLVLARWSPDWLLVWMVVTVLLTAIGARYLLPAVAVQGEGPAIPLSERLSGLKSLLSDRDFMLAMVSAGLIQSAHAFYYGFSALVWKQQGVAENLTGVLWATGVVVEIGFLWFLEPWWKRLGPRNLLLIGGIGALVRWTGLAFAPPLWLVFPLQGLHALSYCATFLAALQFSERLSTPANASGAQLVNSALSGGVLSGLATMAAGVLFDRWGGLGYLAMTAMTALGLLGAVQLYRVQRLDD